jgi:uncharacterized membrane protein YfcA
LPYETLALAALIVGGAYLVFGMIGFGSTVLALPLLAFLMPLKFAIPLILMMDLATALVLIARVPRGVRLDEVWLLTPSMIVGFVLGMTLLIKLPEAPLLAVLGAFLVLYAGYGLARRGVLRLSRAWSAPFGFAGGALSAMFGTGGVILVAYISGRIADKNELRATAAAFIFISAAIRVVLFGVAGLLTQEGMLASAAMLLPVAFAGLFAGSRLHAHIPALTVVRIVYVVLALAGASLLVRVAA